MNSLKNRKKEFKGGSFLYLFLACLLVSSSAVFLFQHFYFPKRYADIRVAEMEGMFSEEQFFASRARSLLDTRNDVGYVRLLDHNGVLEKSFGFRDDEGFEKLTLGGPDGKAVLLGLKISPGTEFRADSLLWSLIFGAMTAVVFAFLIRFINDRTFRFMGEFSEAMNSVAIGDYSVRLDEQSPAMANAGIGSFCREFNEMVSSLDGRPAGQAGWADPGLQEAGNGSSDDSPEPQPDFSPRAAGYEQDFGAPSPDGDPPEDFVEGIEVIEEIIVEDDETVHGFEEVREEKEDRRNISILVINIADFEELAEKNPPSAINSITAEYRESVSETITSFGGTVESVLRDEVLAFFTSTDPDFSSGLSCVCCAVEIIQIFAGAGGREPEFSRSGEKVKLKMGISCADLVVPEGSDVFALAKPFVEQAKVLCGGARPWNMLVTSDFRTNAREYLEVRHAKVGDEPCYAVTGVDEEALERAGK